MRRNAEVVAERTAARSTIIGVTCYHDANEPFGLIVGVNPLLVTRGEAVELILHFVQKHGMGLLNSPIAANNGTVLRENGLTSDKYRWIRHVSPQVTENGRNM